MADEKQGLRRLSTGLIAAGIVVVLVVGGYLVWSQVRGAQTRRDLRLTPPAAETSAPVAQTTAAVTAVSPATSPDRDPDRAGAHRDCSGALARAAAAQRHTGPSRGRGRHGSAP